MMGNSRIIRHDRRRLAPAIAIAALALLTAGCAEKQNGRAEIFRVEDAHPITVQRETRTQAVTVDDIELRLSEEDLGRLDGFIAEFLERGGGRLQVSVAVGAGGPQVAREQAEVIRKHVLRRGVRPYELLVTTHVPRADAANAGPIVLTFDSFSATPPRCGDFSKETSYDGRNTEHPNFGCSTQTAIAAMISNPADLVQSRSFLPSDATRKNLVINNYRQGQPTPSELSQRESETSIRQLSQ